MPLFTAARHLNPVIGRLAAKPLIIVAGRLASFGNILDDVVGRNRLGFRSPHLALFGGVETVARERHVRSGGEMNPSKFMPRLGLASAGKYNGAPL